MTFRSVLVANRGEIACRVIKSARSLGYETVAVYSEADHDAPHVRLADKAVCLGAPPATESYLDISKVIEACRASGAEAVHPGYGFLSENTAFVSACEEAGIVFIGPPSSAMAAMGKKREAKDLMREAGVPVVPGSEGQVSDDELKKIAHQIEAPVMIKASAGGGGRGMRLVRDLATLDEEIARARSESESAFGDGELIVEKAVLGARHVEIQVMADAHGNCVHLGERDCSVQRRHQKVLEEAPSPAVDETLRQKMGAAAVQAAKAIGYVGAGTVEFLLGEDKNFYFMEMNTRLQVEHPVTEIVTDVDLVALQLAVAAGERLPFSQDDVTLTGHAIEARLYAEDAWGGFLPQTGRVLRWRPASGAKVRVDDGIREGQLITPHYDAMVAKIIGYGKDRDEALRQLTRALRTTELHGVVHNLAFLDVALSHPEFQAGRANTKFVDEHLGDVLDSEPKPSATLRALAAAVLARGGGFRTSGGPAVVPLALLEGETRSKVRVSFSGDAAEVDFDDDKVAIVLEDLGEERVRFRGPDGVTEWAALTRDGDALTVQLGSEVFHFVKGSLSEKGAGGGASGDAVLAPMAGLIVELNAEPGQKVSAGETLCVLEAMKMQLQLKAPRDGVIDQVRTKVQVQVDARDALVTLVKEDT